MEQIITKDGKEILSVTQPALEIPKEQLVDKATCLTFEINMLQGQLDKINAQLSLFKK